MIAKILKVKVETFSRVKKSFDKYIFIYEGT
jgi:hypothetical protein